MAALTGHIRKHISKRGVCLGLLVTHPVIICYTCEQVIQVVAESLFCALGSRWSARTLVTVIYYHKKHNIKTLKYYYVCMTGFYDLIKALPAKAMESQCLVLSFV